MTHITTLATKLLKDVREQLLRRLGVIHEVLLWFFEFIRVLV